MKIKPWQKEEATGKWLSIYRGLGISIREDGKHGKCPLCGRDGNKGMRMVDYKGNGQCICTCSPDGIDGWSIVQHVLNVDFGGAIDLVADLVKVSGGLKDIRMPEPELKTLLDLRKMFSGAKRYKTGDMIDAYLTNRGLSARPSQQIWLNSGLFHPETKKKHPAVCGLWQTQMGEVVAFHRTYLDGHGCKLEGVKSSKLMSPKIVKSLSGGAIRMMALKDDDDVLCIGEGLETSLACSQLISDYPAWCCTTNVLLEKFELPEQVADQITHFIIPVDADRKFAGQASAFALAKRLRISYGKTVNLVMPDKLGCDCLDILNGKCEMIWI